MKKKMSNAELKTLETMANWSPGLFAYHAHKVFAELRRLRQGKRRAR